MRAGEVIAEIEADKLTGNGSWLLIELFSSEQRPAMMASRCRFESVPAFGARRLPPISTSRHRRASRDATGWR